MIIIPIYGKHVPNIIHSTWITQMSTFSASSRSALARMTSKAWKGKSQGGWFTQCSSVTCGCIGFVWCNMVWLYNINGFQWISMDCNSWCNMVWLYNINGYHDQIIKYHINSYDIWYTMISFMELHGHGTAIWEGYFGHGSGASKSMGAGLDSPIVLCCWSLKSCINDRNKSVKRWTPTRLANQASVVNQK